MPNACETLLDRLGSALFEAVIFSLCVSEYECPMMRKTTIAQN